MKKSPGDLHGFEHGVAGLCLVPSPRVLQQLADRDGGEPGIDLAFFPGKGLVGEQREDRCVEAEMVFLILYEREDGGSGDRFGYAGDAEERRGRHGNLFFPVGPPIAFCVDQAAFLHDGQCAAGDSAHCHVGSHGVVEAPEGRVRPGLSPGEEEEQE